MQSINLSYLDLQCSYAYVLVYGTDWFNRPFEIEVEGEVFPTDSALVSKPVVASNGKASSSRARSSKTRKTMSNFTDTLSDDERAVIVSSLHRVMKPFLLRRVKSDVMKEVPEKIERIVHCPLSKLQLKLHK